MTKYYYGNSRLITDEKSVVQIFNHFFTSIIKQLHEGRNKFGPKHMNLSRNPVLLAVNKFQNHPNILKIKSNRTCSGFSFRRVNYNPFVPNFSFLYPLKTEKSFLMFSGGREMVHWEGMG